MLKQLAKNVWKIQLASNCYFLNLENKIIIDTGIREERSKLLNNLLQLLNPQEVEIVLFTHLHYDHIGNYGLFGRARFYASLPEIRAFLNNPIGAVCDPEVASSFKPELGDVSNLRLKNLEVIHAPGHTIGSICIWYPKAKILFSGDTLFKRGYGRTDLPTSEPALLATTLEKLKQYPYEVLAPGHG